MSRPFLAVVLGLAALLLLLVALLGRGSGGAPIDRGASAARPPSASPVRAAEPAAPAAVDTARAVAKPDEPAAGAAPDAVPSDLRLRAQAGRPDPDAARFSGERGRIRGFIDTADATPFPASWTLLLEPSRTLAGRDRAERRVLTFSAGEKEFVVPDLPLAGYDLCAEAPGLNALRSPVLLDRKNRDPYVTLQFYPAGFVTGRLLDHEHLPADEVPVTLSDAARNVERETRSDVIGNFRFDGVLDGEYTLTFGRKTSPLLPVERLRFSAPSLTLPERELPPLARLSILVLDEAGRPVPDVTVRGSGPPGGTIEETTDAEGAAIARYVPAGSYRLSVEHELLGRIRSAVELKLPEGEVVLRFSGER